MIKELCLVESFAEKLHPDVRNEFISMCRQIDSAAGPFFLLWDVSSEDRPASLDALITSSAAQATEFEAMRRDGIRLFTPRPYYENYAVLATNDRSVARKYNMHHESEFLFRD
jgi:hypothetical protein